MTKETTTPVSQDAAGEIARIDAMSTRHKTACGPGATMVWRRWGTGPNLVLIHGGAGSWMHWIRNIEALAVSHTVWAPDIPGFGDSDLPGEGFDADTLYPFVQSGLGDLIGDAPFDLVGFSFGALVAAFIAATQPANLRRLVLVSIASMGLLGENPVLRTMRGITDPAERKEVLRHNLHALMLYDAACVDELAMAVQASSAPRDRVKNRTIVLTDVLRKLSPQWQCPAFGIWARQDLLYRNRFDALMSVSATLGLADRVVIEDAGHWVQYEKSAEFNETLEELLQRPVPATGMPLAGLKVLELGHIVAGPAAGQILADMGADVIKVESLDGGDQVRQMPGSMTSMFHLLNRNKRSVALDLKGEGAAIFLEMAARADIVIDNFSYGAVERLGLGYEVVSKTNPGLIWLSIKGFLPGPSESQSMLDELAQMAGGLAYMTGTEQKPTRAGASIIDIGAAAYGIIAVLAALRQRDCTGKGQRIVSGLYETAVYYVGQWMATSQYSGEASLPLAVMQQGSRMGFSVYQLFDTADGQRVFIGIMSDAHWARFRQAFGAGGTLDDERFTLAAGRLANRAELNAAIGAAVIQHTRDGAMALLKSANVPCAPVRRPDELADEEHLKGSGQLVETPFPNGKTGHLPKLPFRASGFDMPIRNAAPALGADTAAVLGELGYTAAQVLALIARKAVRMPAANH